MESLLWKGILRTYDSLPYVLYLNHCIGQISRADVIEGRTEKFSLKNRWNIGHNNNDSRMQSLLAQERHKFSPVVGYKRRFPLPNRRQQLPVFQTPKSQVVDMISNVACGVCHFHERCVQTFINQEFQ